MDLVERFKINGLSFPCMLEIRDLHVEVEGKEILKGVNMKINRGEIHALMGPNGSGKSTLSYAITGHPKYKVTEGQILLDGKDITALDPTQRARAGIFLAFQYPLEISGVPYFSFLRSIYNAKTEGDKQSSSISIYSFNKLVQERLKLLKMDQSMIHRYLNEGFSGGEKKKAEVLQMAFLEPKLAILDELDSGLDIDSIKGVAEAVNALEGLFKPGLLLVTHYMRILNYLKPDYVHVLVDGKIALSGGFEIAQRLEEFGYNWVNEPPTSNG